MKTRSEAWAAPVLRVELACDFNQVRSAAERVQDFLREHRCPEPARVDCELVLVEGCNNAIKHSQPQPTGQTIVLEVILQPSEVELRITDHGPGFNWPETTNLPRPEEESGRGLYLIRRLTDYASYFRAPQENTLVLRKRLS